jgi:hypothetical protein
LCSSLVKICGVWSRHKFAQIKVPQAKPAQALVFGKQFSSHAYSGLIKQSNSTTRVGFTSDRPNRKWTQARKQNWYYPNCGIMNELMINTTNNQRQIVRQVLTGEKFYNFLKFRKSIIRWCCKILWSLRIFKQWTNIL